MKVAVMQPYFFPYIGYFQLIEKVDYFVIFDDVNYIKGGWINKNRTLQNGNIVNITLPIQQASQNRKINQHQRTRDIREIEKIKKKIQFSYCKTKNSSSVFPLINSILDYPELNLALYLANGLINISSHLGFSTKFIFSSQLSQHEDWDNPQDRIIDLTKKLGGTEYFNLPGGKDLYDEQRFAQQNVKLNFITPELKAYKQLNVNTFIPGLSIIDYLMFNNPESNLAALCK